MSAKTTSPRLSPEQIATFDGVTHYEANACALLALERARGVLLLLQAHFEGESRLDDRYVIAALDAVDSGLEMAADVLLAATDKRTGDEAEGA